MAVTVPLSVAVFADRLMIENLAHRPGHQQQLSGLASGGLLAADVAAASREYDVTCARMENDVAAEVMALIEALDGSISDFFLFDPRKAYPKADPTGALLGSNTVQINSLNANNKAMSLKGLPAGYVLSRGDLLAWDYATGPVRRAFHRVLETVTANGSGVTPEFDVRHFIRPGSAVNATVTLIKAAMRAKMLPGTLRDDTDGPMHTRISFSVRQVV